MRTSTAAAVAGLCGFATMGMELTAVRLLAPHFGDSAYVWTNVIGVILAALAFGAYWGGRMADRRLGRPRLALLFAVAALLIALVPLVGPGLAGALVPDDLPLDHALPVMVRGSLVATVVLFGLPVLVLGTVTPMLVVLLAAEDRAIGRAIGIVSALSTTGSLLGTFAATHVLVPGLGCRATLWLCAAVLALCGLLVRPGRSGGAALLLIGLSLFLHGGPLRPVAAGRTLLAERETPYQYLQVVQRDGDGQATTELQINEGLDSFHSVAVAGSALTGGRYYDFHAVMPWLAGDGQRPGDLRILSVGDAAGSFERLLAAVHPGAVVDGAELDPAAVELGARFFGGRRGPGTTWSGLDGRVAVTRASSRYHVVLVDAYAHQVYIPAHLASREFFRAVGERLHEGGVVAVNVGGLHPGDPVLAAVAGTMAHVYGEALAFRVPASRNYVLAARKGRPLAPAVLEAASAYGNELGDADRASLRRILGQMADAAAWHRYGATPTPLTDDRPELDRLLHRSYVAGGDDPAPVATGGQAEPGTAEAAAHQALRGQDPVAVIAAVRSSRADTAYLRLLCGDARWHLRQLHGAAAEYERALELQPGDELAAMLRARRQDLAQDLTSHTAAESAAVRNGWLALLACLGLLGLAIGAIRAGG